MSEAAQRIIRKYTECESGKQAGRYAALCAATGILPWAPPTAQDHATLLAVLPLTLVLYGKTNCMWCLHACAACMHACGACMHALTANKAEYVLLVCKVCLYVVSSALVSFAECQALGCAL